MLTMNEKKQNKIQNPVVPYLLGDQMEGNVQLAGWKLDYRKNFRNTTFATLNV